jgi:hypothetical protein
MELPDDAESADSVALQQEFDNLTQEHLRSHPGPELARFWLRRFLDDVRPADRALAVKRVYTELLGLWGDYDLRGVYTIDEVLGGASVYRLWLAVNRCAWSKCDHGEAAHPPTPRGQVTWHDRLLGSILPPPRWNGTSAEWRQLVAAIKRNCTCLPIGAQVGACAAHRLLADADVGNRLVFGRRMALRLLCEEFADRTDYAPLAATARGRTNL